MCYNGYICITKLCESDITHKHSHDRTETETNQSEATQWRRGRQRPLSAGRVTTQMKRSYRQCLSQPRVGVEKAQARRYMFQTLLGLRYGRYCSDQKTSDNPNVCRAIAYADPESSAHAMLGSNL